MAECLSLAALPLTVWTFGALPDWGFALSKILAILLITWATWWVGNFLQVGGNSITLWLLVLAGGLVGWLLAGRTTIAAIREAGATVLVEEILFVTGFCLWALMRSFHPDIGGMPTTEKPMDLMLLQTTSHAASYPPQDLWLAGHAVNYYYFGYLSMANVGHLAGTSVLTSFNLAVALIFGLAVAGTYSIVFNLTKSRLWSLLGPVMVILIGNSFALFMQVTHGQFPWNQSWWFWNSSRVVGLVAGNATTINEFPLFSLILGDLHPHVLAIPVVLLSISFALSFVLAPSQATPSVMSTHPLRLLLAGITIGSLFATNSWDFPPYLLLSVAALFVGGMVRDASPRSNADPLLAANERTNRNRRPVIASAVLLVIIAGIAFLPFYVQYQSPTNGIGIVSTITNFGQFATVLGFFGFVVLCFTGLMLWQTSLFSRVVGWLVAPSAEAASPLMKRPDRVIVLSLVVVIAGVATISHRWVLLTTALLLAVVIWLLTTADHHKQRDSRTDLFTLLAIGVGALVLVGTELAYVRDSFDGTSLYRMNTVFKFYYQAWILLGLAASYAVVRIARCLSSKRIRPALIAWLFLIASGIGIGGVYTVLGPVSYYGTPYAGPVAFKPQPLNGMGSLASQDPQDYQAIVWMQHHLHGLPTVLEASGDEFTLFAQVSSLTGFPTLLGWEGHELQWRGNAPILESRHSVINEIYSTGSSSLAQRLLRENHVSLVYVGPCERQVYASGPSICGTATTVPSHAGSLAKFGRFMKLIYRRDGVQIYERRDSKPSG